MGKYYLTANDEFQEISSKTVKSKIVFQKK